ncbi:MAG: BatA domain-containing protein [Pseudomonadota bacterium]
MGLSFANPAALALLGLLAVPVLVHLLAQGDYQVVPVGSLRWLRSRQRPRWSRLLLRDPWRMALRCALVGALALALARPEWTVASPPVQTHVLVDPRAEPTAVREAVAELRARATAHTLAIRWLAAEFPPWDDSPPDDDVPLYDLLSAADGVLAPGPLVVLACTQAHRLGWRRPSLARAVEWVALPSAEGGRAGPATPARSVAVVHDGRPTIAARIAAAVEAWAAGGARVDDEVRVYALQDLPPAYVADWVVWLGSGEGLPASVADLLAGGATVLSDTPGDTMAAVALPLDGEDGRRFDLVRRPSIVEVPAWRALTGEAVLVRGPSPRQLRLLGALKDDRDGLLGHGSFPTLLLQWLEARWRAPLPGGLDVTEGQALPARDVSVAPIPLRHPLAAYLLAAALLLWAVDRVLQWRSATAGASA